MKKISILALSASLLISTFAIANEVNIFNARHYKADAELYGKFTAATGIKVNLINGKSGALEKRIISKKDLLEIKTLLCTIKHGTQFRAFKGKSLDYTQPFNKEMLLHLPGSKKPSYPYIFGDVGIGVVEKVGPNCKTTKVGDIVWGYMKLQEINVISEQNIYKMENYSENFLYPSSSDQMALSRYLVG